MLINAKGIKEKLEDTFDFEFNVDVEKINTYEEFNEKMLQPFKNGQKIYYRGERIDSPERTLIPTIFREKNMLFDDDRLAYVLNARELKEFYNKIPEYCEIYEKMYGNIEIDDMYTFLSFSQHYLGLSPFIDFTKSLYVALSFALKDRNTYTKPVLIYTLELVSDDEDYTNDINIANKWVEQYSVLIFKDITHSDLELPTRNLAFLKSFAQPDSIKDLMNSTSPRAMLIDVPTNDLMRYQQGVFLYLDDFSLVKKSYFTKKIRQNFKIKKWLINEKLCVQLHKTLIKNRPYYAYDNITDLSMLMKNIKSNIEK